MEKADIWERFQQAALEDLEKTSDEDLLKEAKEDGIDISALAASMRARLLAQCDEIQRQHASRLTSAPAAGGGE